MSDETESILRAISTLSDEIRAMAKPRNSNGGLYGVIATFVVVIISLGTNFSSMIEDQRERVDLLAEFQEERLKSESNRADLLATFQQEKLDSFMLEIKSDLFELDKYLQLEFNKADIDSEHRHNEQQEQIDEIKAWFKPPALRNHE